MADYIERGDAFDAVMGQYCACSDEAEAALNGAIEDIRKIPAADVRPVVRGRWIGVALGDMRCSNCGEVYGVCGGLMGDYNFCPNCGAMMDGGTENEAE